MDNGDRSGPAFPRTALQSSLLKSSVFAGAITGQLTMGLAGDVMGRRRAMLLTNSFSICGALGSALFTWGEPATMYTIMMVCRFVLGIGVGGKYPLAATISKEDQSTGSNANKSYEVSKAFFWQTPGAMLPYVVGIALLGGFGTTHFGAQYLSATNFEFRFLLGIGALPTIVCTILTYRSAEGDEYANSSSASNNPFRVAVAHPEMLKSLAGCGLSWFLYDFIYYGTSFNQVQLTDTVFGDANTLFASCWQNVALTVMGLPGVLSAIWLLLKISAWKLQICGFALSAVTCGALAVAVAAGASDGVKFTIFCSILFALNWGVNVTTYCLPAEVFPKAVRTTFFGLAAGMGKVGALIGSASFASITDAVGFGGVYALCAGISVVGLIVTVLLVPQAADDEISCES